MNKSKYFALFSEDAKTIRDYCHDGADRLAIFDAMLAYLTDGDGPTLDGIAAFAWTTIRAKQVRGEEVRAAKAEAGRKGGSVCGGVKAEAARHNAQKQNLAEAKQNEAEPSRNQAETKQNQPYSTLLYSTLQNSNTTLPNTPSIPQGGSEREDADAFNARDAFEAFWSAYPRKVGKDPARKAYAKSIKGVKDPAALAAKILAALDDHKHLPQWQRDNGQYIPHAATWLHQRRWEDEVSPSSQTTSPSPATSTTTAPHQAQPMTLRERCEDAIWAKLVEVTPDIDRSAWAHYVTEQSSRFVMRIDEALAAQSIHNKDGFITMMIARDAKYHADKAGEDKHNDAIMHDEEGWSDE